MEQDYEIKQCDLPTVVCNRDMTRNLLRGITTKLIVVPAVHQRETIGIGNELRLPLPPSLLLLIAISPSFPASPVALRYRYSTRLPP